MNRKHIEFISMGVACRGWFYDAGTDGSPCIVMAHGFCGAKEHRLDAYAERFASQGFHVLVFDYRHFGESGGTPRQILDIKKQHQDWRAAIEYARSIPGVDAKRLVLWGTSFSGGHVIEIAADDGDIAAVISQVPHINGIATTLAKGVFDSMGLTFAMIRDQFRRITGRGPYYVPAFAEPGTLAAMNGPGDREGVIKLLPPGMDWTDYPNYVAARIFFSVPFYSPGKHASKITMPWLLQIAELDSTTPAKAVKKAAGKSPSSEVIEYKGPGHFDVYVEPHFERTVGDQIEFLKRHLDM